MSKKIVRLDSLIYNLPKTMFKKGDEYFLTITSGTKHWLSSYRNRATNTDMIVASDKDIITAVEKATVALGRIDNAVFHPDKT